MSFRSMSVSKRMSDSQFIGDLMSLLERRKIKLGNPESLENFGFELASNDALRSDLFTLCTAISHMAETDLSGEQLLMLVARALGGPGIAKSDGFVEVPEGMRSAFLSGYEAWGKRGSEPNEPLSWPPARPVQRSEPLPSSQPLDAISEPVAPRVAGRGQRTVQEALDIARERAPFDTPAHRSSDSGTNIEGLTLSQLKKLLEDIEHRVSRIEPQLRQLDSGLESPAESGRREKAHELRDLSSSKAAVPPARPATLPVAAPVEDFTASRAPAATPQSAAGRATPPVEVNEAAFLERHVYLKPTRRPGADIGAPGSRAAANPGSPPRKPGKVAPAQPPPLIPARRYRSYGDRDHHRMVVGVLACIILFVVGYAGVYIYHDLNPDDVYAYPEVKAPDPSSAPSAPLASGQSSQSTPAEPIGSSMKAGKDGAGDAAPTAASVPVGSDASTLPASSAASAASAPARSDAQTLPASAGVSNPTFARPTTTSSAGGIYVPSSKMMGYAVWAPRPIYPGNRAKDMEGAVVLQVTISKHGNVMNIRTVSGPMEMRAAAVQAVRTWHFKPYLVNGYPTQVVTTLELPFKG